MNNQYILLIVFIAELTRHKKISLINIANTLCGIYVKMNFAFITFRKYLERNLIGIINSIQYYLQTHIHAYIYIYIYMCVC